MSYLFSEKPQTYGFRHDGWFAVEWLSVELKHNEILWSQREIFRKWF